MVWHTSNNTNRLFSHIGTESIWNPKFPPVPLIFPVFPSTATRKLHNSSILRVAVEKSSIEFIWIPECSSLSHPWRLKSNLSTEKAHENTTKNSIDRSSAEEKQMSKTSKVGCQTGESGKEAAANQSQWTLIAQREVSLSKQRSNLDNVFHVSFS